MKHLYGEFTQNQISQIKKTLQGSIFFNLVCADKRTSDGLEHINIDKNFENLLLRLGGLNTLLMEQPELVTVMSLIQAAKDEYARDDFDFRIYKKLILDACSEISKLKEE